MASNSMNIRIDPQLRNQANQILKSMGLSMSGAIRMFLTQVVAQEKLPLNQESFEGQVTFSDSTFKAYLDALQGINVEPMPNAKEFEQEMGITVND